MNRLRLLDSAMAFNFNCLNKLKEKEKEGWVGWDDWNYKFEFQRRMRMIARRKLTQKNLVNIANYCMFLWNLIEEEKGGN